MKKIGKFFSYIWNKLKHNWGMKVLSLFFAIILWNFVITGTDPLVTRTFEDLPITVYGDKQLSENNLALKDSILSYIQPAKVTVEINRSESRELDKNDISVRLELSSISATGTYNIQLFADVKNGNVQKITPESITIEIDEKTSRIIPIVCSTSNENLDGYYIGPLNITPNNIQVTGAKSIVSKIASAHLTLDLSDKTQSISLTKKYEFIDSEGNIIDSSALSISSDSVLLEMSITPIKTLEVVAGILGEDLIATGFEVVRKEIQPETIEVTGSIAALEGLVSVSTESINLDGLNENTHVKGLKILLPEGVSIIGGVNTADVLIVIQEKMEYIEFEGLTIELRNIPENLKAVDFAQIVDVNIKAPVNTIGRIAPSHITLYVDLTGAQAGEITLPILYEIPEEYRVNDVILSQETVTVVLQ